MKINRIDPVAMQHVSIQIDGKYFRKPISSDIDNMTFSLMLDILIYP